MSDSAPRHRWEDVALMTGAAGVFANCWIPGIRFRCSRCFAERRVSPDKKHGDLVFFIVNGRRVERSPGCKT